MNSVKTCPTCGQDRKIPDEIRPRARRCDRCKREYHAAYREANRERQREYERRHRTKVYGDPASRERERRRHREDAARRRASNPVAVRAAAKRYRDTHRESIAANSRRAYLKRKADKERWANYLADQRMRYRLRREKQGKPVTRLPAAVNGYVPLATGGGGQGTTVSTGPFQDWLRDTFPDWAVSDIASEIGVSERRLREIERQHQRQLLLATVDRAFTTFGDPGLLSQLYPIGESE